MFQMKPYIAIAFLLFTACVSSHATTEKFKAIPSAKDDQIRIEYGKKTGVIKLGLEKGADIENFFTVPAKDFQAIGYQYNVGPDGASAIIMYDPKNLKELWRHPLDGFNLSVPFVDGDFVYLACIAQVAKLDIKTGKVIWEHKDLYEKYEFNGGDEISKKNGMIHFSDTFKVEDGTGKIKVGGK